MAVYTIDADGTGYLRSDNTNYSNARSGSGLTKYSAGDWIVGQLLQSGRYYIYESFLSFDTSGVTGTIVSAELKLYVAVKQATESYTVQARIRNYGSTLETSDWVAGASLSGLTLVADKTSAALSAGSYNTFSDVALAANIDVGGTTRIIISSSDTANNDSPTLADQISFKNPSSASPPQLVITTADSTNGELDKTIAAFTLSSTATRKTNGALSREFGTIGLSAEGSVGGAGEGVLNQSIGTFTLAGTIARKTNAYLDVSIGDFTIGATTAVAIEGTLSQSIGRFIVAATAGPKLQGVLSQSIGNFSLATSNSDDIEGVLSASIGAFLLVAVESGPPWPVLYDFPQSPLDGTWRRERGDDTLRSGGEVGARAYRARSGGNYADVTFAIMVKSKNALDLLDRFYRDECKNGATPFYWIDPETGDNLAWLWAAPPQIRHVARETYRVECALLKEAA